METEPFNRPTRGLPSPRSLVNEAWRIFRAQWTLFVGIAAFPVGFLVVIAILIGSFQSDVSQGQSNAALAAQGLSVSIGLLIGLLQAAVQLLASIALIVAAHKRGEHIQIGSAYRESFNKLGSFLLVSFLTGIAVSVGYILLIIPGIIFSVWFSLAIYVNVVEGIKGTEALRKSKSYVEGYWYAVAGRILYFAVFVILTYIVFGVGVSALGFGQQAVTIIGYLFLLVFQPLSVLYSYLLYRSLVRVKAQPAPIQGDIIA